MSTIGVKAIKYPDGDSAINITDGGNVTLAGTLNVTGTTTGTNITATGSISSTDGGTALTLGVLSNATTLPALNFNGAFASSAMTGLYGNGVTASNLYYTVPSSKEHIFSIADSQKMVLNSSGNLGLGTNSPSVPSGTALEIYGASASRLKLSNSTTGTGATDGFQIYTSGSSAIIEQKENAEMRFYTNGSERVRIDSIGRVMIGNTTEGVAGADEFTVGNTSAGNGITIRSASNSSGALFFSDGTSGASEYDGGFEYNHSSQFMRISTAGSERMRITSAGNVGIGNTNPEAFGSLVDNLVIGTTSGENGMTIVSGTGNSGRIQFADNTASPFRGAIEYAHGSTDALMFYTAGGQRMRIDSSGNVGIGTTPSQKLHVAGAGNQFIYLNNTTTGDSFYFKAGSGASSIQTGGGSQVINFFTSGNERVRIDANGRFGVGVQSLSLHQMAVHGATGGNATFKVANTSSSGNTTTYLSFMDGSGSNSVNSAHFQGFNGANNHYLLGNGTTTFTSDEIAKKNIETTRDGYLEDLAKLRVVKYNWKEDEDGTDKELGLIAQEVEKVFPKLVMLDIDPQIENKDKKKMIKLSVLPLMLLKALQEANTKITTLEAEVKALKG